MADDYNTATDDDQSLEQPAPPLSPIQTGVAPPTVGRGRSYRAPPLELDHSAPDSYVRDDLRAPATPKAQQGAIWDYGNAAWASALSSLGSVASGAQFASREIFNSPTLTRIAGETRDFLQRHAEATIDAMSDKNKQALSASLFHGNEIDPATGQKIPSVWDVGFARYAAMQIASNAPMAALAFVPGGILARVGMGIGFGAMQAGDSWNKLATEIANAKPDELMQSPAYADAIRGGASDLDARRALLDKVAPGYVTESFGLGAATGAALPGVGGVPQALRRALLPEGAGLLRRGAVGAAEGSVLMGGQAGAQNYLDQSAAQKLGLQKDFDKEQLALDVASGVVGGGVLGTFFGMVHKPPLPEYANRQADKTGEAASRTPGVNTGMVDAERQAALADALGGYQEPVSPLLRPAFQRPGVEVLEGEPPTTPPRPPTPAAEPLTDLRGLMSQPLGPEVSAAAAERPGLSTQPQTREAPPDGPRPGQITAAPSLATERQTAEQIPTRGTTAAQATGKPTGGAGAGPGVGAASTGAPQAAPTPAGQGSSINVPRPGLIEGLATTGKWTQQQLNSWSLTRLQGTFDREFPATPAAPVGPSVPEAVRPAGGAPGAPAPAPNTRTPVDPKKQVPEPERDTKAQIRALQDPNSSTDAVYSPTEIARPKVPGKLVRRIVRPDGQTIVTTNLDKAAAFKNAPVVTEELLAQLLQYPETKAAAVGPHVVVQARDAHGNVVRESVASAARAEETAAAHATAAPGGTTHVLTPEEALARRGQELAKEPPPSEKNHPVERAAKEVEAPTAAQHAADNYKKGHLPLHGLDISIDTPRGEPHNGAMQPGHHGTIRGTGERPVEVTLGPGTPKLHDMSTKEAAAERVIVVDKMDPKTGKFAGHQAFIGYAGPTEAMAAFREGLGNSPLRAGGVKAMTFGEFKEWVREGNKDRPLAYDEAQGRKQIREARKQQMAAPGEARKGEVATVEAPPEAKPAEEPAARSLATDEEHQHLDALMQEGATLQPDAQAIDARTNWNVAANLRQDVRRIERLAENLRAGDTAAIEKITDKLTRLRSEDTDWDKVPGAERIGAWVKKASDYIENVLDRIDREQTTAAKEQAPPGLTRLQALKEAKEAEAAAAAESRKRQAEAPAVAPETKELPPEKLPTIEEEAAAAEKEVPTVGTAETPAGRSTPERKSREVATLLQQVLNKEITPEEAHSQYGVSGGGRPRKFKTFAEYVRHYVRLAADAGDRAKFLDRIRERLAAKELPAGEKRALTRELNLVTSLGNEHMQAALNEILTRAEEAAKPRLLEKLKEVLQVANKDPEFEKTVNFLLARPRSIHEYLNTIIRSLRLQATAPQYALLAQRLKAMLPRSMQIMSFEDATRLRGAPSAPDYVAGRYIASPDGNDYIALNSNARGRGGIETILHEMIHAATARYIKHLFATDKNHPHIQALLAIREALLEAVTKHELVAPLASDPSITGVSDAVHILGDEARLKEVLAKSPEGRQQLGRVDFDDPDFVDELNRIRNALYSTRNLDEVVTGFMTDARLHDFAAKTEASPELIQALKKLGFPTSPLRSIWQSFVQVIKRIMGAEGVPNSLLEHVMRPVTDIVSRGAAYARGEQMLRDRQTRWVREASGGDWPFDEVHEALRSVPDPDSETEEILSKLPPEDANKLRDLISQGVDRVDPKGWGDTLKRWWLNTATGDAITAMYRKLFTTEGQSLLDKYRTAHEAVARFTTELREHAELGVDKVNKLAKYLGSPEGVPVARLMRDATTANVRLGDPDPKANSHLGDDAEKLKDLRELQDRYGKLTDSQRKLYNDTRDLLAKLHEMERSARLRGMLRSAGLTEDQVKAVEKFAGTAKTMREFIEGRASDEAMHALGDVYSTHAGILRPLLKIHNLDTVQGDYFPLRRYGDYMVRYGDEKTKDYGMEMFERRSQAERRRAELVKKYGETGISQVYSKRDYPSGAKITDGYIQDVLEAAGKNEKLKGNTGALEDILQAVRMSQMVRSEAARNRQRREGVLGASTDMARVLTRDWLAITSRIGNLEGGAQRSQAFQEMQNHVKALRNIGKPGDAITAQMIVNELGKRQPIDGDDSSNITPFVRKMNMFGYAYSLLSPSHMLASSIEAASNTVALLGARHGVTRAVPAFVRAQMQLAPALVGRGLKTTMATMTRQLEASEWNLADVARDRLINAGANREQMTALFSALNQAGLIDHTFIREIQRLANGGGTAKAWGAWQRFMDFNNFGQHATDVLNRSAGAKAAFDLEMRRSGGDVAKSIDYAVERARMMMPNWNSKARLATSQGFLGRYAPILAQFKGYGFHEISVIASLAHRMMNDATPGVRKEMTKALALTFATRAMAAGILGALPFELVDFATGAYDLVTGADKPHDWRPAARNYVADMVGNQAADAMMDGLPHLVGMDFHRRTGLNNLLELPQIDSFDKAGFMQAAGTAMTGAAGEDVLTVFRGLRSILQGDLENGIRNVVPRPIRDVWKAVDLSQRGVVDAKGKTILPPERLTPADIAYQAIGVQPSRVTEFRAGREAVYQREHEETGAKSRALQGVVAATDPDGRESAMEAVRQYNEMYPDNRITTDDILKERQRARSQAKRPQAFGLALPKKGARGMAEAGAFANY